jgi:ABC-2 type transport system permease protein
MAPCLATGAVALQSGGSKESLGNSSPTMTLRFFRLLLWVHWRGLVARTRGLRRRSPLLPLVLAGFVLGYLFLGYLLFYHALRFLYLYPPVGSLLAQRILFLIFGFFFVMLTFSNVIIGYTTLFKNRETDWFLTLPIAHADIYRWKFLECLVVSSWALMFLSAPMMAAFGRVNEVKAPFYLQVILVYLPFIAIPAVLGSVLVLLLVALLAKRWTRRLAIGLACAGLVALVASLRPQTANSVSAPTEVQMFDQLLRHTHLSLNPFLPSAWMARTILSWSGGLEREGGFFFLLLLSNALFGLLLGFAGVSRFFYGGWTRAFGHRSQRSQERAEQRRQLRTRPSLFARLLDTWVFSFIGRPVRALVLKDVRVFWREPAQWTQVMIFVGLLTIYVLNLRNVSYDFQSPFWSTTISYLNLTACALTLSTLTTRFVFPQFSLEGRRLWILGMAPLGLPRVLMQKFCSSCLAAAVITTSLMITSSMILKLGPWMIVYFALAIALMSGALCGMAVGLGALFPNFKEDNPSKIVSGFGGTLCLVASFVYIVVIVTLLAFPASLAVTSTKILTPTQHLLGAAASAVAVVLSALALIVPLALARRRLKNMEF